MTPRGQEGTEDQAHGGQSRPEQPVPVLGWFWPRGRGLWGRRPAAWESSGQLFIASPAAGRGSRVSHRSSPLAVLPGRPDLGSPTLGTDEASKATCAGGSSRSLSAWVPPKGDMLSVLRALTRSLPLSLAGSSAGPGACQLWALEGLALPPPWTVRGRRQLPTDSVPAPAVQIWGSQSQPRD